VADAVFQGEHYLAAIFVLDLQGVRAEANCLRSQPLNSALVLENDFYPVRLTTWALRRGAV